ncbi:Methyl-CpG-binding domain protein 5 [Merluccius polli]|uniref:Methyl-CpG-binding domain protein 5 n=1 Tax=Merluccius polli TaxID=89951 RepID=A0AA47MZ51_MERPO|nr:Methyl-CpG-binding domain protein 5 [Merluccius polli]
MDRTVTYGGGGHCPVGKPPAQVPIGWQRKIHHGCVVYISPSGSVLACLEQAKSYLQTDGTCKCGLECPLILHKVFNFDPGAAVTQRTAEDVKADSAVTKLCIHKRKIIAVAALQRSMESQMSSRPPGGCHIGSLNPQAIRKDLRNGPSNSVTPDGTNSYKLPISGPQHYVHKHQLGSPPLRDAYAHPSRSRPGAGDHNSQRSPYRSNHHSGLLSPPSTTTCSSQHYGDRTPFLRSPESAALSFHGALSPGSGHVNGERFVPLSPPSVMVHGPPSSSQLSCALAGRTSVSSSPSMNTKSPNRQRSPCGFPQNTDYQHKSPSSSNTQQQQQQQQQHPIPQHAPYIVQKRCMSSSEKDPLGILDPIPSLSDFHDQAVPTPSRLQVNNQAQVASVHAPPAVVPLPSNLPMPVVKSGVVGPGPGTGPRVQQHPALSSISSSPVRSPVHMALPSAPIRLKDSSLHPHTSVSSSHYGSVSLAAQVSLQQPSRGPVSSPKTSVPLHHMTESVIQPLVAINAGGSMHSESIRLPPPRTDGVNQTRLALKTGSRQLDRQNPPTFPASSLLSAAAKAQLVHQNNLGGSSGHPGLVGGGRQPYSDGCSGLEPQYLRVSGVPLSEGQSGRAALRDKLMSQQRGTMRKRKTPGETDGDMSFHMNMQHGPSLHGYPEPTKRLLQQGVATNDASMAPLVQPINHQLEAQNGLSHACQPPSSSGKPLFFEESVPSMSNMQNVHGPLHLQSRDITGYRNFSKDCRDDRGEPLNMEQFARQVNQTHNLPFVGNMRTLSYGGHEVEGSICNQNSQQSQMGHHVKQSQSSLSFKDGTGFPPVMSNGGFEMYPESGKARFPNSASRKPQNGSQRRRQQKQQPKDALGQLPVQAVDFLQCPDSLSCCDSSHHPRSPGSMNGLLRTFKVSLAERIPHPASMVRDQPQAVGLSDAMCFQASQQELAIAQVGHHHTEANPTSQQVRAGLRGEAASSVIVRNCAFSASQAATQLELPQSVIHGPPRSYPEEPVQRSARARRTPTKLKQVNGMSSVPDALLHFGGGTQAGQWSANTNGGPQHGLCRDERSLLQARAQDVNGNSFHTEFLARHALPSAQEQSPSQLNVRSGGHTSGSVIQSPEHYPASDGRQAYFPKRSNGYLNGQLNGNYSGRDEGNLNGSFVLNIAEGQMSEERLGPVSLHHPGRPLAHRQPTQPGGDLLWAGAPSFHPWPSKMKMDAYLCSVGEIMQSKVEPVRFHQTLKDDLDTLHKANGIHLSAGAVNDRMEDAVHDAMGQWNKLTANIGLDGVRKAPKAKKRKIFR